VDIHSPYFLTIHLYTEPFLEAYTEFFFREYTEILGSHLYKRIVRFVHSVPEKSKLSLKHIAALQIWRNSYEQSFTPKASMSGKPGKTIMKYVQ